jgi:hypothetical protein
MLDKQVLRTEKRPTGHTCCFYHKRWYGMKYGLRVFKKGIVIDDDLHGERYS